MNIITLWLDWVAPLLAVAGWSAFALVIGSGLVYGLCELVEALTAGWDDE